MRMTRAALRAQESEETLRDQLDVQLKAQAVAVADPFTEIMIHEDSDKENSMISEGEAKNVELEHGDRKALKDITDEQYPSADMAEAPQPKQQPVAKKGRKTKGKLAREAPQQQSEEGANASAEIVDEPEVPTDDIEANTTSSMPSDTIAEAQNEQQSRSNSGETTPLPKQGANVLTSESAFERSSTPQQWESPRRKIANILRTPRFSPGAHSVSETSLASNKDEVQDSFVEDIKSRSPSKHATTDTSSADSFVGDITSRSPARSISSPRVEDSVAALDALEDAIEKIAEDLPPLDSAAAASPTKQRTSPTKSALRVTVKPRPRSPQKPLSPTKNKMTSHEAKPSAAKLSVKDRIKAFETKPSVPAHRRAASVTTVKVPKVTPTVTFAVPKKTSHKPSKSVVVVPSKPMVSPPQSPAKPQQNMVKKRVPSGPLSTSKPGFVTVKSSKPLTKSAFVLPGDAIAAKLKAQREERLKKDEEASKKKEFKARPAPVMTAGPSYMPRENKTSQARMQRLSGENKENVSPVKSAAPKATITAVKARSTINQPNSSVRRTTPVASTRVNGVAMKPSGVRVTSNESTRSTSSSTSHTQTAKTMSKNKEAVDRRRLTIADVQREKKEKEEAAKKARAEAAERGRQASREWAEKQKRRLLAEKEAKSQPQEEVVAV